MNKEQIEIVRSSCQQSSKSLLSGKPLKLLKMMEDPKNVCGFNLLMVTILEINTENNMKPV